MGCEILFSVIIPVYRAEKYLDECIGSIVKEKSKQLEVILIDDGSPDKCPQICDKWVRKDSRICCVHQNNAGPSAARNHGIQIARGKYIAFVDSDDKLSDDAVTKVLKYLENQDSYFELCFMNINKFYNENNILTNSDKIYQKFIKNQERILVIKYLASRQRFPGSPCSKIYLKEFLTNNQIYFPSDNRKAEDLGFVLDCIRHAERFDSLDFNYYLYRQQQEETRSNTLSDELIKGIQMFIDESIHKLCNKKTPINSINKYLLSFVAYEFQILMYFYYKSNIKDWQFLTYNKWVLRFGRNIKGKIIYRLSQLLGVKQAARIINKIKG